MSHHLPLAPVRLSILSTRHRECSNVDRAALFDPNILSDKVKVLATPFGPLAPAGCQTTDDSECVVRIGLAIVLIAFASSSTHIEIKDVCGQLWAWMRMSTTMRLWVWLV